MKKCPECGCENEDFVKFCKNCGLEFNHNENSQNNTCPKCGNKVDEGMKFCKNCGSKLSQEQKNVDKTKFCTNCGAELSENAKFCPECGISPNQKPNYNQTQSIVKSNKSPLIAGALSFFIPGLGQGYLGLRKRGIQLFLIALVGLFMQIAALYIIVWVYSFYDGYNTAEKINKNIDVKDKIDLQNLF